MKQRKNILIIVGSFRHGGISRALQNLLSKIDPTLYCIDVFAIDGTGPYNQLLDNCEVLTGSKLLKNAFKRRDELKGFSGICGYAIRMLSKFFSLAHISLYDMILQMQMKKLESKSHYSTIIAFCESLPTRMVSFSTISNRICWVHCDYASYISLNKKREDIYYSKFHKIVCVSDYTRKSFVNIYPQFQDKITFIYNVLDTDMMKRMALEQINDNEFKNDKFTIVSVGRIDPVKNLSSIPEIAHKMKEKECEFRWFIIGPKGTEEETKKLFEQLEKYKEDDCVYYLGSKDNPYQYYKNCNLVVNTSLSEACPYVVNEAKVLHVPVVCNNFGSAVEFVDNTFGDITPLESMHEVVAKYIMDPNYYLNKKSGIESFIYDNNKIIHSFNTLIN